MCLITDIVSSPQSVNISLNKVAVFNCTAIADSINWLINGSPFDNRSKYHKITVTLNEAKSLHKSTLTANASPLNNKTKISCFVVTLKPFASLTSEPALLLIQGIHNYCTVYTNAAFCAITGLLESVNDLHSTAINSTTVLISWSPPFTLQGVPILGYNVTITNTISGENETMLVEDTTLLYSIDTNNNHTATVVPINEAGEGDPAFITIEIPIPSLMMFTPVQGIILNTHANVYSSFIIRHTCKVYKNYVLTVETSEIKRSLSTPIASTIPTTTSNTPSIYTAPVGNGKHSTCRMSCIHADTQAG